MYKLNIGGPGSKSYEKRCTRIQEEQRIEEERIYNESQYCTYCGYYETVRTFLDGNAIWAYCENPECDYKECGGITTVVIPDLTDKEFEELAGRWYEYGEQQ